jgi:hypothetical protein
MQSTAEWAGTLDFANLANWTLSECLWCLKLSQEAIKHLVNTRSAQIVRNAVVNRVFELTGGAVPPDPYNLRLDGERGPYEVLDRPATSALVNNLQQRICDSSALLLGPPPALPIVVQSGDGALMNAEIQSVSNQLGADNTHFKAALTRGFADIGVRGAAVAAAAPAAHGPVLVPAVPDVPAPAEAGAVPGPVLAHVAEPIAGEPIAGEPIAGEPIAGLNASDDESNDE